MKRLPNAWRPYLFAATQASMTTGVATGVAAFQLPGGSFAGWLVAWAVSFAMVLPLVLVAAPVIRRGVEAVTR